MDMKERLQELAENARKRIEESEGLDKLNDVRVAYLGKKGEPSSLKPLTYPIGDPTAIVNLSSLPSSDTTN